MSAITIGSVLAPRYVHGWGGKFGWNMGLTVFLVAFAMFGFFMIIRSNIALTAARAEVARLAAENERSRIARDLHDLLGHSLTTITVKAGLARRLAERRSRACGGGDRRGRAALRRTLGEVRAAVAGYREVTLAGELASAREVLRAAGIDARLPGAVDAVDADAVEPFGWVVREGGDERRAPLARGTCTITVGPRWIEIVDDGTRGGGHARRRQRAARAAASGWRARRRHGAAHATAHGWVVRAELAAIAAETGHRRCLTQARSGCCSPMTRRSSDRRSPRCSNSRTTSRSWRRPAAVTRWWRRRSSARPDVALLDIEMPGVDGIAAAAALRARAAVAAG